MTQQVGLFITFWAAPGKIDALVDALQAMMPQVAEEAGTLAYGLHRVIGDREGVSIYEIYADQAASDAHGATAAVDTLKAALPGLLAGPPERYALTPVSGKGLPF